MTSGARFRALRAAALAGPVVMALGAATAKKKRYIHDSKKTTQLANNLVRSEGDPASTDAAVNEAYDYSGTVYDFYWKVLKRNSLDGAGMPLVSSVHVADVWIGSGPMSNAFFDGSQMAYGDGDGVVFNRFTRSLDVVAHELTHGVVQYTSGLIYAAQSGALNEHFADVFGVLTRQWKQKVTALKGNWLVGAELMTPAPTRRALRDMENPGTAFVNDPEIGSDPQPGHMDNLYKGALDDGGVHINSGIPNRAFVLFAKAIKGKAWGTAGEIWYDAMRQLWPTAQILDCAQITMQIASGPKYSAAVRKALKAAWKKVGLTV